MVAPSTEKGGRGLLEVSLLLCLFWAVTQPPAPASWGTQAKKVARRLDGNPWIVLCCGYENDTPCHDAGDGGDRLVREALRHPRAPGLERQRRCRVLRVDRGHPHRHSRGRLRRPRPLCPDLCRRPRPPARPRELRLLAYRHLHRRKRRARRHPPQGCPR